MAWVTKGFENPSLSILGVFFQERVLLMLQRMHATSSFWVFFTRRGC